MKTAIELQINGDHYEVLVAPNNTLLEVLREKLGLVGTKRGCDLGACGACTVLIDGEAVLSCLLLALDAVGKEITTIEGLSADRRAPPPAAGLCGSGRAAMRILHAGHDPDRPGDIAGGSRSYRREHQEKDGRQSLPLYRI